VSLATEPGFPESPRETPSRAPALLVDFPADAAPAVVGKDLALDFASRKLGYEDGNPVHYAEACTFYGALAVARLISDGPLIDRVVARLQPLLGAAADQVPSRRHVDDRVFGIAPLELTRGSGDWRCLALGIGLADAQWSSSTDGITDEARYWVDDMYMITSLQVQAYRATRDAKYLDRAATTMVSYLDRLQEPSGLFFHTKASPVLWGRGNGWAAAGLTELLSELPSTHPARARVLDGYRRMMTALVGYQDALGLWHQILDDEAAWAETSGSGMFTFALISGVKNGWLTDMRFGAAARAGWLGLVGNVDRHGQVKEVCVGTGEASYQVGPTRPAQVSYYLDRPRVTGDMHGQAPALFCAAALLR